MTAEEAWAYATMPNDAPLTREEHVIQLFESLRDSVYRYVLTLLREPPAAEEKFRVNANADTANQLPQAYSTWPIIDGS